MMTSTNTVAQKCETSATATDAASDDEYTDDTVSVVDTVVHHIQAADATAKDDDFYDDAKNQAYDDADDSNDDSIDEYVDYCGMWGCEYDDHTAKEVIRPQSLYLRMKTYVPLSLTMMSFWWLCFVPLLLVIVVLPLELLYALFTLVFAEHCLVNGPTAREVDARPSPNTTEAIN